MKRRLTFLFMFLSIVLSCCFVAQAETIMTHDEYITAKTDSSVSIDTYVQATQEWRNGKITVYAQSPDGAYYIFQMLCSEEDASKLVTGTPIRVKGTKQEWSDEMEIEDATFEFRVDEPFIAAPYEVT